MDLQTALEKQGFTLNKDGSEFIGRKGYIAALSRHEEKFPLAALTEEKFNAAINRKLATIHPHWRFMVGGWIDSDILYLDIVAWFRTRQEAENFAKRENQLAFWDCENQVSIPLTLL